MPGTRKPYKRKHRCKSGRPKHSPELLLWRREKVEAVIDTMRRELAAIGVEHPKKEEPPC